jgi:hypothetical protein
LKRNLFEITVVSPNYPFSSEYFSTFAYKEIFFFYSCTVHLDVIKVSYLPNDAQQSCSKGILKFTLKQLLLVSVQSSSSGSLLFVLAKVIVIKIIS